MVPMTRAQREALFRIFQREFPNWISPGKRTNGVGMVLPVSTIQYRRYRKAVKPLMGGDGCVMIFWKGMWLGIERDGYVHS